MNLDQERDRILTQQVKPAEKARMFIAVAQKLQLDNQQWQYLVWTLPVDVTEALAQIRRKGRSLVKSLVLRLGHSVLWLLVVHAIGKACNNSFGADRVHVHPCCV